MADPIQVGDASVDPDDPCAMYAALYAVRIKFLAGTRTEEIEIRSPSTSRRVRFGKGDIGALDQELARLRDACSLLTGGPRRRYAKSVRFRSTY